MLKDKRIKEKGDDKEMTGREGRELKEEILRELTIKLEEKLKPLNEALKIFIPEERFKRNALGIIIKRKEEPERDGFGRCIKKKEEIERDGFGRRIKRDSSRVPEYYF